MAIATVPNCLICQNSLEYSVCHRLFYLSFNTKAGTCYFLQNEAFPILHKRFYQKYLNKAKQESICFHLYHFERSTLALPYLKNHSINLNLKFLNYFSGTFIGLGISF